MEAKLRTAILSTINDYYAIDKEIHAPYTTSHRELQLSAAKEALEQVLQHFRDADYIEYVDGCWQIKVIVIEGWKEE